MTKAPYGLEPLMTNSPESWHSQTKTELFVTLCLGTPVYLTDHQVHSGNAPSGWWGPEKIFSLVTKPSSQDIEQGRRKNLILFLHRGPTAKFF